MKWKIVPVAFLAWLAMMAAGAQPPDEDTEALQRRMQPAGAPGEKKEIAVDMFVNYGFAYRDGTWVPLDVMVRNPTRDVKGWLEVRTYGMDQLQSPIYRTPIESPRDSTKRFQVGVFLRGTTRIEVQLFSGGEESGGGRRVFDFAPYLDVTPIETKDLMVLVLDEDATGFGFLNTVAERQDKTRRLHRETLTRSDLPRLAVWPQCYEPFDCIVLANTDPEGIGARQRELFYEYVSGGGTLVVCTGDRAEAYHGTWIEELAGVTIGAEKTVSESEFAAAAFDEANRAGARDFRQIAVAALEPSREGVARLGKSALIATRTEIGSGHVYVVSVDPESRALQSCEGFVKLWQGILARRQTAWELNMDSAAEYAANTLPRMSGIVIHSKSSVMLYLLLYFFVAIVGNWLVFNWLKRREWFWVTLVVFAVGFTGYAVVFGTSGRASKSELHKVEVVRLARQGGSGRVHSNIGVLTARSANYTIGMANPHALAQDLTILVEDWRHPGSVVSVNRTPFFLVQTETPKVANFRVGASEMRLVEFNSDAPVAAHVEGTVSFNAGGKLEADIMCDTGYVIDQPFVWANGAHYRLVARQEADGVHYRTEASQAAPGGGATDLNLTEMQRFYGGMRAPKPALTEFRDNYLYHLFAARGTGNVVDLREIRTNPTIGPVFGGWIKGATLTRVETDRPLETATDETLLLADVSIGKDSRPFSRVEPLGICAVESASDYGNGRYQMPLGASCQCFIGFPPETLDSEAGDVVVNLVSFAQPQGGYRLVHENGSEAVTDYRLESDGSGPFRHVFYIAGWRDRLVDAAAVRSDVRESQLRVAMPSAMGMRPQVNWGGLVLVPDPPPARGEPAKYLILDLTAPPAPEGQMAGPAVDVFSLEAGVVVLEKAKDSKEDLPWH